MSRPPAYEPPPGHVRVPRQADERWRIEDSQHQCSQSSGSPRVRCAKRAVAELNRRRHRKHGPVDAWYCYCVEHLAQYGRWIEDGKVMGWIAVPIETAEVTL